MGVFARHTRWLWIAVAITMLALALFLAAALTTDSSARAGGANLSQLSSALGANQATQSGLAGDLRSLNGQITTLNRQIDLVRGREASVQTQLETDRRTLAGTRRSLTAETTRLARLRRALTRAQTILADQLVSRYEQPQANLVSVVLSSHGFSQLLDQLQYLSSAEHSQQQLITVTARARRAANAAADRLKTLQHRQMRMTRAASIQVNALAGMNTLLSSRQTALGHIESARTTALDSARAEGGKLRSAISTIKAQQAAARAAAAATAAAVPVSGADTFSGGGVPSGGWAIPAAVVMCESGGQNLPPNRAGASGYYQILGSTWTGEGGSGPAAYLAPKSEQDAIAAKLWDGGAGARNWVCAGIVGIT
jgi:peptidoglycan hydrolase CwlO-like protein